jgi:acetate kinase
LALVPLVPLHEPYNLAPIKMATTLNPDLPQIACFDTAFHRTAPEVEQAFALPYSFYEEGVRRYGFHGCPTNTSPRCCRSTHRRLPTDVSSWRTLATAARLAQ